MAAGGAPNGRLLFARHVVRVCLPGEIVVAMPGLGEVVCRPVMHGNDAAWMPNTRPACEEVCIASTDARALLLVESAFARHIVQSILGCDPVSAVRPLSRIERGVLHGALAAWAARLGLLPEVRVCAGESPTPGPDSLVIEARMGLRGGFGRAWVCATVECLARFLSSQSPHAEPSSAQVAVELGRTGLLVSELAEAREGDVVVFDGVAALTETEPWPVLIRGGHAATPAVLRPDGVLVAAGSARIDVEAGKTTKVERIAGRSGQRFGPANHAADAVSVEIVAEIGRLRGAALAALLRGASHGTGRSQSILLRRDGSAWAEGELLAIDNALAVRIKRKLAD